MVTKQQKKKKNKKKPQNPESQSHKNVFTYSYTDTYIENQGFPSSSDGKESGVGKIPWRREWQPIPVFLPGEIPWTEEPGEPQSTGLQRVGHD